MTGSGCNWTGILCQNELEKSMEHKWKIKIIKTSCNNIMVGVAPIDYDINTNSHKDKGWYLVCHSSTLYSGPPFNYSNKNMNLNFVKKEIIVVMNMNTKTLKFIIDNDDKGDSYTNIPIDKPITPAVLLYNKDDCIEIIDC